MIHAQDCILEVALASALRKTFDYLPPESLDCSLQVGVRIKVPFGKREIIGVIVAVKENSDLPKSKLKRALQIIDATPLFDNNILKLYEFAALYYQHAIGDIIFSSLPPLLREGSPATRPEEVIFCLTTQGANATEDVLKHAIQQRKIINMLKEHANGLTRDELVAAGGENKALTALLAKGFIQKQVVKQAISAKTCHEAHILNEHQQDAVNAIINNDGFNTYLLEGVTGSGKTEVYMQCIDTVLKNNKQVLVLVPEIGLTPQTVARFQARFNIPISILHSGLSEKERCNAWVKGVDGTARIIIGTRSAILTPLPSLGMIILDEEHDSSFKQQSGFRYSARDLAVMRGKLENIPVILGSATPCLESLHNAKQNRFRHLILPVRAGKAIAPNFHIIDVRNTRLEEGFSPFIFQKMQEHLEKQGQILIFLNRRGYAPTLLCHACGWIATCKRCDAHYTYHMQMEQLICHHCMQVQDINRACGACQSRDLILLGAGTQRLEKLITEYFPKSNIMRIDRDSTRRKGVMAKMLATIHSGESDILIGTQMLAKGHHFPDVTMVVITDVDGHLYSTDFRACERLGQIIVQVAGRAGRCEKPGEVYLQTHSPDNPLLKQLLLSGYNNFAQSLLEERKNSQLPPFSHLALFRAQASKVVYPQNFLLEVRDLLQTDASLQISGPIPALMEKKAGQFRAQLLVQSNNRSNLQNALTTRMTQIDALASSKKVRWSIDVDPLEILS